jgi:hypothetical protein
MIKGLTPDEPTGGGQTFDHLFYNRRFYFS